MSETTEAKAKAATADAGGPRSASPAPPRWRKRSGRRVRPLRLRSHEPAAGVSEHADQNGIGARARAWRRKRHRPRRQVRPPARRRRAASGRVGRPRLPGFRRRAMNTQMSSVSSIAKLKRASPSVMRKWAKSSAALSRWAPASAPCRGRGDKIGVRRRRETQGQAATRPASSPRTRLNERSAPLRRDEPPDERAGGCADADQKRQR